MTAIRIKDERNTLNHKELIIDFAETFSVWDNVIFVEVKMGSTHLEGGVPIPDLFVMKKSFTKPNIRIYDIKATTSDLMGDIRDNKFEKYLPYCDRFYFACGPDVKVNKEDVKRHKVGLVKRGKNGWRTIVSAPRNDRKPLDEWIFLSLLMYMERMWPPHQSRAEKEKEVLAKHELFHLSRSANKYLADKAHELEEKERRIKRVERNTREEILKEFAEKLECEYIWKVSFNEIYKNRVIDPIVKKFKDDLESLIASGS